MSHKGSGQVLGHVAGHLQPTECMLIPTVFELGSTSFASDEWQFLACIEAELGKHIRSTCHCSTFFEIEKVYSICAPL